MKRSISLIILLFIVFLGIELAVTKFMKKYTNTYDIYNGDIKLSIKESYLKNNGDNYNIEINDGNNTFIYLIKNTFNKQKKIISDINYYKDGDNVCIYPILKDNSGTYIECMSNGNLYSGYTYSNQGFIESIKNDLNSKGYNTNNDIDLGSKSYSGMELYVNNIKDTDTVAVWQYKGINIFNKERQNGVMTLGFDKYENKLGTLVGKYYVIPGYTNSNVLEFSYVNVIDITNLKEFKIELYVILSSNTYVNGIVNGKLYYTDPSSLQQVEVNPSKKSAKLIGTVDLGGKTYDGEWKDVNIYDLANNEVKFIDTRNINYSYKIIKEGKGCYYFYKDNGIYQVVKGYLDKPILVYNISDINNLNVAGNSAYYVVDDTLYELDLSKGVIPILKGKDLIYNTNNRISVYRKD